jgi:IS5 family transposase
LVEKDEGQDLWADSAYTGKEQEKTIKKYKVNNKVHEKGYKNSPLKEKQIALTMKNQRSEQELNTYLVLWSKA